MKFMDQYTPKLEKYRSASMFFTNVNIDEADTFELHIFSDASKSAFRQSHIHCNNMLYL